MCVPRVFIPAALLLLASGALPPAEAATREPLSRGRKTPQIGLYVPQKGPAAAIGTSIRRGVALALQEIAPPVAEQVSAHLVTRPCDGPWGAGHRNLVQLAYGDRALAILGAPDRITAHLAAQIAAKARVPVITPWAASDSITLTGVPWVFRTVPGEREQACILAGMIAGKTNLHRVALLVSPGRQHQMLGEVVSSACKSRGLATVVYQIDERPGIASRLAHLMNRWRADGFVLCTGAGEGADLLRNLRGLGVELPGFGLLELSGDEIVSRAKGFPGSFSVLDLEEMDGGFADAFRRRYGRAPDAAAAFAYDAAQAVFRALAEAGPEREAIRSCLSQIRFDGATGSVAFDRYGQRVQGSARLRLRPLNLRPFP